MDPATLAMNAIALIAPYLKHTAQRAADHVTDAAAKRIAGWVKEKLIGPGEPEAVAKLEEAPDDVTARKLVGAMLEARLKSEPVLAEQLAELIDRAEAAGLSVQTLTIIGDGNQAAQVSGTGHHVHIKGKS